jgi:hypothetical protein
MGQEGVSYTDIPAPRLFFILKKVFVQEPFITEMVIPVYAG